MVDLGHLTHFGHRNIIKFQQRPESHEAMMLSEWIWAVRPNDQILHLGDVFLGPQGNPARWAAIISCLPGEKFLMLGNHDRQKRWLYEQAGFTIIEPFIHQGIAFTHRPISAEFPLWSGESGKDSAREVYLQHGAPLQRDPGEGWHTNIHGHTHGNDHRKDDGDPLAGKIYVNICVEVTEFKPRQLGAVCPLPKSNGGGDQAE